MQQYFNPVLAVIILLIICYLINLAWESNEKETLIVENALDPTEDFYLIGEINNASTPECLMDIVYRRIEFFGEENNAVMRKALFFGNEICRHDWAEIFDRSEEGSPLELVAKEKAGKALEKEF